MNWRKELASWIHALAAGALGSLATALTMASDGSTVLTLKSLFRVVALGAAIRGVGCLIAKVGP